MNGQAVSAGPLKLSTGANLVLVTVEATEDGATARPVVEVGGRRFGIESGRQLGVSSREPPRLKRGERVELRRTFVVGEPGPAFFPRLPSVYLPRGARNLLQPYLRVPGGIAFERPVLCLDLPAAATYVAADEAVGVAVGRPDRHAEGGRAVTWLPLDGLWGSGFELSLCWADANGRTITYQPAIRDGGTCDWRHRAARVKPPAGAVWVTPLIIKWQDRGITGTFWVDNVQLTDLRTGAKLLDCGTFDEPAWGERFAGTAGQGAGGSRCVKIVCTAESAQRQQAQWVRATEPGRTPVKAGEEYQLELDVKCDNVAEPGGVSW
ncbi:MAG: hypothetical protein HYU66_24240 [Armatimonadetes bacterium]|nr:hypothetical protein [Armatimonadota bacterium]